MGEGSVRGSTGTPVIPPQGEEGRDSHLSQTEQKTDAVGQEAIKSGVFASIARTASHVWSWIRSTRPYRFFSELFQRFFSKPPIVSPRPSTVTDGRRSLGLIDDEEERVSTGSHHEEKEANVSLRGDQEARRSTGSHHDEEEHGDHLSARAREVSPPPKERLSPALELGKQSPTFKSKIAQFLRGEGVRWSSDLPMDTPSKQCLLIAIGVWEEWKDQDVSEEEEQKVIRDLQKLFPRLAPASVQAIFQQAKEEARPPSKSVREEEASLQGEGMHEEGRPWTESGSEGNQDEDVEGQRDEPAGLKRHSIGVDTERPGYFEERLPGKVISVRSPPPEGERLEIDQKEDEDSVDGDESHAERLEALRPEFEGRAVDAGQGEDGVRSAQQGSEKPIEEEEGGAKGGVLDFTPPATPVAAVASPSSDATRMSKQLQRFCRVFGLKEERIRELVEKKEWDHIFALALLANRLTEEEQEWVRQADAGEVAPKIGTFAAGVLKGAIGLVKTLLIKEEERPAWQLLTQEERAATLTWATSNLSKEYSDAELTKKKRTKAEQLAKTAPECQGLDQRGKENWISSQLGVMTDEEALTADNQAAIIQARKKGQFEFKRLMEEKEAEEKKRVPVAKKEKEAAADRQIQAILNLDTGTGKDGTCQLVRHLKHYLTHSDDLEAYRDRESQNESLSKPLLHLIGEKERGIVVSLLSQRRPVDCLKAARPYLDAIKEMQKSVDPFAGLANLMLDPGARRQIWEQLKIARTDRESAGLLANAIFCGLTGIAWPEYVTKHPLAPLAAGVSASPPPPPVLPPAAAKEEEVASSRSEAHREDHSQREVSVAPSEEGDKEEEEKEPEGRRRSFGADSQGEASSARELSVDEEQSEGKSVPGSAKQEEDHSEGEAVAGSVRGSVKEEEEEPLVSSASGGGGGGVRGGVSQEEEGGGGVAPEEGTSQVSGSDEEEEGEESIEGGAAAVEGGDVASASGIPGMDKKEKEELGKEFERFAETWLQHTSLERFNFHQQQFCRAFGLQEAVIQRLVSENNWEEIIALAFVAHGLHPGEARWLRSLNTDRPVFPQFSFVAKKAINKLIPSGHAVTHTLNELLDEAEKSELNAWANEKKKAPDASRAQKKMATFDDAFKERMKVDPSYKKMIQEKWQKAFGMEIWEGKVVDGTQTFVNRVKALQQNGIGDSAGPKEQEALVLLTAPISLQERTFLCSLLSHTSVVGFLKELPALRKKEYRESLYALAYKADLFVVIALLVSSPMLRERVWSHLRAARESSGEEGAIGNLLFTWVWGKDKGCCMYTATLEEIEGRRRADDGLKALPLGPPPSLDQLLKDEPFQRMVKELLEGLGGRFTSKESTMQPLQAWKKEFCLTDTRAFHLLAEESLTQNRALGKKAIDEKKIRDRLKLAFPATATPDVLFQEIQRDQERART